MKVISYKQVFINLFLKTQSANKNNENLAK